MPVTVYLLKKESVCRIQFWYFVKNSAIFCILFKYRSSKNNPILYTKRLKYLIWYFQLSRLDWLKLNYFLYHLFNVGLFPLQGQLQTPKGELIDVSVNILIWKFSRTSVLLRRYFLGTGKVIFYTVLDFFCTQIGPKLSKPNV